MKIGVKYCGGCNPRYNRKDAFETIKEIKSKFQDIEFHHAEEGESYDLLLVIGGCTNRCASIDKYNYSKIVHVWSEESIGDAIDQIKKSI